jgi:predicted GTPase
MEEYEPHIDRGTIVYAGVDYEKILRSAEKEADIILWDGGNNDLPFYKPDLNIVVTDPHRSGHEISYFPGESNFLSADVIVINKLDSADLADINKLRKNISEYNSDAIVVEAASPIFVDNPALIKGKRVLVVEDGPTLTHGEMKYGAGVVAAQKYGAKEIIDPRPYTFGSITKTFLKYPEIGKLLPAMGYGRGQVADLSATINKTECDSVIIATPIDLTKLIEINKPHTRVRYELSEIGQPDLRGIVSDFLEKL